MNAFDKLELSTETIRELTAEEMAQVAAGAAAATKLCDYIPTYHCTGHYESFACAVR